MKISSKNLFLDLLPALIIGLGLMLANPAAAQIFTNLHNFKAGVKTDGFNPYASLIISGSTLYGTTYGGGSNSGVVFAIKTDGTGYTNVYTFTSVGNDGYKPHGELLLSGNTLYGTTEAGGTHGAGNVFKVNTDGSGFVNLHTFTGATGGDGGGADGGLVQSGSTLYGTTATTVFKININGLGFTNLHVFTAGTNDGAASLARLLLSGNTLYGTTRTAGASNGGTIFAINTDGTGYTNLYNFSSGNGPFAGLILANNTLYGTTFGEGATSGGTVFRINTDGTGYTNLHSFAISSPDNGAGPYGPVILWGRSLYGTTEGGGRFSAGTVYKINTDGTGYTNVYSFTSVNGFSTNGDGYGPTAGLILSGSTLYGTTEQGGLFTGGTVFSLTMPKVTLVPVQTNLVVRWPTNALGLTLQSVTNLSSGTSWTNVSQAPVVLNGQNVVTNPVSGAQKFYRLY